jgi:hypothetical protein
VAHVAAHELGAAAYAIKAARAAAPVGEADSAGRLECRWQREQLPDAIRDLILHDQRLRNEICWSVFDFVDSAAIVVARRRRADENDAALGTSGRRGSRHRR